LFVFVFVFVFYRYSEWKSSYAIYYTDFSLLFVVIKLLKMELVFRCRTVSDCDDVGIVGVTVKCRFLFHLKISVFHWHLCY